MAYRVFTSFLTFLDRRVSYFKDRLIRQIVAKNMKINLDFWCRLILWLSCTTMYIYVYVYIYVYNIYMINLKNSIFYNSSLC